MGALMSNRCELKQLLPISARVGKAWLIWLMTGKVQQRAGILPAVSKLTARLGHW